MEQAEGDADMAREVAQSMLDDKVAELEEAQKQQPKEGKSVAEKIAARKEHKSNIERIEKEIEQWQQIIQSGEERSTEGKSRSVEAGKTPAVGTKSESGVDGEVKSEEAKEEAKSEEKTEEALQPIGKGVFGNIYDQFKGKVKEAFDFLMKHKSGDLLGVFHRDGFGDIDLVWGDNGGGLAHIVQRHVEEQNDFNSVEEVRDVIDDVIKNGKIVRENADKVNIDYNGYRVSIRKNVRDGQGNIVENKNWVVTAFDRSTPKHEKRRTSSSETLSTPSANQEADEVTLPSNDNSSESKDTKSKAANKEKLDKLGKMGKAVDMKDLPKDMAYRETDVNELEDILESGQLRDIPEDKPIEGISDEGVTTRRGRTFNLSRPYGRSHGGKGFAKGMIWTDGGGTLAGGTATKVIIGFPGNVTQWREGFHNSYSDAKNFDDIEHGSGLWLPFDENGAVPSLPVKDMKVWVEGEDGKFHEFTPKKPLSEQISTASAEVDTNPTEAQKEAGNYKKGHVQVGAFDITIEQPQGSIRRGKDANGKQWESKMNNTYGYFRGTEGVDGDHIDVFLSNDIDGWNGRKVFVVDQYNPDGTFDEHKVMLGFNDVDEAKSDYLANYENGWENGRRIDVTPVNLEDFEKWIRSSHRKTKAFAEYAGVKKEDSGASENGEGKEEVKPQEELKPKKPTNEKGEESKADGEKGKGEKIDDELDAEEKAYLDWKAKDERDLRKKAREYIGSYYDYGGATPPEVCAARALSGIKITPESFRAHTGYSKSEQAKLVGLIAKKENGGVSIDRACELAALEFYEENGYEIDFYEMRDIVLDVLREGNPRGYEKRYLEEEIKKVVDHYKYERDMSYEAEYGMDYDTYMRDPERRKEVLSSAAKSKSQDTDGDRRISVPEDDPLGGGVPDGNVPFHRAGESNGELTKAEVALRDAVVGVLRKSGIDVVSDVSEGQRVLDMANGKERLSGKQKRALETASLGNNPRSLTVVSSADGAKVLKNVDELANKLDKSATQPKTFIGDVAKALGAKRLGSGSEYATFETKNGLVVTIRLSNHNAHVSHFDYNGRDNGISIVISPKPNEKLKNDGNAHITEFYYNAIKLRRADGKPLSEIVRSIKQALYSGEFKDTTGIAERQEVNGDVVREHRVYHGSGADFDSFDHSHMGEGEGAQAYGWGTYVTEVEGIGRTYAEQYVDMHRPSEKELEELWEDVKNDAYIEADISTREKYGITEPIFIETGYYVGDADTEALLKEACAYYGYDVADYYDVDGEIDEDKCDELFTELFFDMDSELENELNNRKSDFMEEHSKDLNPILYTVEIPDDTGENYLDWSEPISNEQIASIRKYLSDNYRKQKIEDFDASIAETKNAPNADEVNAWARRGENVYKMLSHLLGSDEAASKALSEMGFTGIKYPAENRSGGRKDGAKNYVVFNEGDAEIVDKVRFFKTRDGEAYGFTVGGRIYIDPRIASSETAVHEYAHLWAEALRSANAKEWGNVVGLMRGTSVWSEVMERYPELKSDDEIADEVLATYSGRRGSERLRDEMERIKGSGRSVSDKARALGALERVKRALDRFWHGVADFLGIHYKSADEVADRVMRDLLNGVDPRRFVRGESDGRVREQFVGEDGVSDGRGDIPEDAKADLAIENFQQVYADYLEGTERLKEQSDKVSADDNIDAIQGEIKGLEDAYDEAYGELLNALEAMYMAAGVSKVDAKAAAIDRASLSRAEVEMRIIDKRFMKIRSHGAEVRPVKSKVTAIEADSKPKPAEYHSASGNTVSFEGMGGLRKLGKGEFAHVERVFTKSGAFSFSGASKIESIDDVAYIFRNLENYAVENTFAALVKDGVTHVVHLGMGGPVSSMADLSALRGAYDKFGADKIYFVHNHPSGTLRPSQQDVRLFDKIKQMFGSSVEIESLIIDTTSGKFSKIEDGDYRGSTNKKPIGEDVDYEVYAFDRKVYTDMFFDIEDTPKVSSSESVAGFISSHRLGNRKKVSYLVLDNNLNILANIHTNFNGFDNVKGVVDEMVSKCIAYGGRQVVPYGNVDLSGIERVIRGVRISSGDTVGVIDALRIKNGLDYESYNDTHEEAAVYGTHSRTVGDNIEGRGEQGVGKTALQTANERFNSELDEFKNGTHKGLLHLGKPRGILKQCGITAQEMTISPSVLHKHHKKHNLTTDDLKGLAESIQRPILVYKHGLNNPNVVVVTELNVNGGKLSASFVLDESGKVVEVSNISSVHSKDAAKELERLYEMGEIDFKKSLKWVEKEKVLDWLAPSSYENSGMQDNQAPFDIAKIINGFENPKVSDGKRVVDSYDGDLETLFRDADSHVDYERALIRDSYERRMKDAWFQSREALQDGMLSLKETMKDIWRSAGKKFSQITDIPDYANPYLGQNRLSSRNAAEVRDFKRRLFSPLLREVGRLTGFSADGRTKLTDYMMAKHGLERNKVMAERDAKHPNSLTCGP